MPRPPRVEGVRPATTRRDIVVAASAAMLAVGVSRIVGADTAVMGSRAVPWDSLKAEPTKVGEVRHVFQAPTATLDELESHITTLNPGEVPHAPHKHADEEVLCLKEGTLEAYIGTETTRVGPGGVRLLASKEHDG